MAHMLKPIAVLRAFISLMPPVLTMAQAATETPSAVRTPDRIETRIGLLEFKDGAPSAKTAQSVYDTLAFTRGVDAFMNSSPKSA